MYSHFLCIAHGQHASCFRLFVFVCLVCFALKFLLAHCFSLRSLHAGLGQGSLSTIRWYDECAVWNGPFAVSRTLDIQFSGCTGRFGFCHVFFFLRECEQLQCKYNTS